MNLYVYYQLAPEITAAWYAQLILLQAKLLAQHAVYVAVQRRIAEAGPLVTWMETYEGITDKARFEADLAAAVTQHLAVCGVSALQMGARHLEWFEPLPIPGEMP